MHLVGCIHKDTRDLERKLHGESKKRNPKAAYPIADSDPASDGILCVDRKEARSGCTRGSLGTLPTECRPLCTKEVKLAQEENKLLVDLIKLRAQPRCWRQRHAPED